MTNRERTAEMEQFIPIFVLFALGFGAGYGVREWKSQMRRRSLR
jgi:hypothetical protein